MQLPVPQDLDRDDLMIWSYKNFDQQHTEMIKITVCYIFMLQFAYFLETKMP